VGRDDDDPARDVQKQKVYQIGSDEKTPMILAVWGFAGQLSLPAEHLCEWFRNGDREEGRRFFRLSAGLCKQMPPYLRWM
jgi:hypothetical protein